MQHCNRQVWWSSSLLDSSVVGAGAAQGRLAGVPASPMRLDIIRESTSPSRLNIVHENIVGVGGRGKGNGGAKEQEVEGGMA